MFSRKLNRRDCPQGSSLVSVEFTSDEFSSRNFNGRGSPRGRPLPFS